MRVSTIPLVGGFTGGPVACSESADFVVRLDSCAADGCFAECGSYDEAIRHGSEECVPILVSEQCKRRRKAGGLYVRLAKTTVVGSIHSGRDDGEWRGIEGDSTTKREA